MLINKAKEATIMKLLLSITAITATLFMAGCSSSYQSTASPQDDVYYNPYNAEAEQQYADSRSSKTSATRSSDDTFKGEYQEADPDSSKDVKSSRAYDEYYDYEYSSRIRRFHNDHYYDNYYHDYYTNRYWYSYDPYFYGTSIYVSTYPWSSYSYVRPVYGYGFNMWTGPHWYRSYHPMYGSLYAYSTFGYPYWGYYSTHYAGYYGGMYGGLYGGYYGNYGGYYNTIDENSNYYYARRDNRGGGSGLGQSTAGRRGVGNESVQTKSQNRNTVAESARRGEKNATETRSDNTMRRGSASSGAERNNTASQNTRVDNGDQSVDMGQDRRRATAAEGRASAVDNRSDRSRNYVRPSERSEGSFKKPVRYNTPNYAKPRSSREYSSPSATRSRSYGNDNNRARRINEGSSSRSRSIIGNRSGSSSRKYVKPSSNSSNRSNYNRSRSGSRSSGSYNRGGSSNYNRSGSSRSSSSRNRSSIRRSSSGSSSSGINRSSSGSSSRSSGSRSSSRRGSGGGRN